MIQQPEMREVELVHRCPAPRDVVFEAWTDASLLARWWGPHGFTNPVCEVDARPGGSLRIHMRSPDGTIYPVTGTFHEVVPPQRLVFTTRALDTSGEAMFEIRNEVTFGDADGATTVWVRARVLASAPGTDLYLQGMEAGWQQSLERLADAVEGDAA